MKHLIMIGFLILLITGLTNGQERRSLSTETIINGITLLKHQWNWFEFQLKMEKEKAISLKKIIDLKQSQINQLQKIVDNYHNQQLKFQPKWWQSPFMDVVYYLAGFISATIIISLLR